MKELFTQVANILAEKGFELEESKTDQGVCLTTKATEMGNYLQLRTVKKVFVPEICNKRSKEGFLADIDKLVKKIIFEKFKLFTTGLVCIENEISLAPQEVADIIIRALESYERMLRNLFLEKELTILIVEKD